LGHGYICFSTPDEAADAIKQTNRKQISPWNKPFYVALHQPAETSIGFTKRKFPDATP